MCADFPQDPITNLKTKT